MGIATVRVDGNDVLAVYNATVAARKHAVEDSRPVLIEAMTYRVGHHSTSDDSSAYRSVDEVRTWQQRDHPILRFKKYLKVKNILSDEFDKEWKDKSRKEVLAAVAKCEKTLKPRVFEMFTDVFEEVTPHLQSQYRELMQHVSKHEEHYPVKNFEADKK